MSWVRCPSAAPIIKNSRQRGACPQKHRRVGSGRLSIDSWTEQHSQILFSRIISRKHRRASPEPVSVRRCTQHRKYRVGRDTSSPTGTSGPYLPCSKISAGRLDNPCLLPDSHRPRLGDHITKSLPGRRENKDRSSRHASEGILHESWQCYVIRDAESASKRISRYVEQSRYLIQESYRPSSDPRPFLQQSRDAIAECRTIAAVNRQLEKPRIWRGPIKSYPLARRH